MNSIIILLIIAVIIIMLMDKTMDYFAGTPSQPALTLTATEINNLNVKLKNDILINLKSDDRTKLNSKLVSISPKLSETNTLGTIYNVLNIPSLSTPSLPTPSTISSSLPPTTLLKNNLILTMLSIFDTKVPLDNKINTINEQINNLKIKLNSINPKTITLTNNITALTNIMGTKINTGTTLKDYVNIMANISGMQI